MPILNTNFREITAKREKLEGEIKLGKIEQGINILNIKKVENANVPMVVVEYNYQTKYNLEKPENSSLGEIKIVGELLYTDAEEVINNMIEGWKNKKINEREFNILANTALMDANIEALGLAKKLKLPLPVQLPRIRVKIKE